MAMISGMRMLNALENGTLTGAQLQTLLANNSRRGELQVLLEIPGQARRIAANNVTMTAVAASSLAMTAVAASSNAMNAVVASSTAMTAVIASSNAKMAVFNSDTAITAIAGSATAIAAVRAAAQYAVLSTLSSNLTLGQPLVGTNAAGSYIAVGVSNSVGVAGEVITLTNRRAGSARVNTNTMAVDNINLATALGPIAVPLVSSFVYSWNGTTSNRIGYVGMLRCDI